MSSRKRPEEAAAGNSDYELYLERHRGSESNPDDYIREFSFEPELIVGRRADFNSISKVTRSGGRDLAKRPERHVTFLRPNRHSFPKRSTNWPVVATTLSVIPFDSSPAGIYQRDGGDHNLSVLSTTEYDHRRHPSSQVIGGLSINSAVRDQYNQRLSDGDRQDNVGGGPHERVQRAIVELIETDRGEDDEEKSAPSGRKRRKRPWWRWWRGSGKGSASSAEQVHHDIEAFYYVGSAKELFAIECDLLFAKVVHGPQQMWFS